MMASENLHATRMSVGRLDHKNRGDSPRRLVDILSQEVICNLATDKPACPLMQQTDDSIYSIPWVQAICFAESET
jgi:hypothetical protein